MGWKGIAIGGWLGSLGGGPLGALLGAVLGHQLEKQFAGTGTRAARPIPPQGRALVFCASAAAMLAKMAKADGCVTRDEIDAVEAAFARLGFSAEARAYAVQVFRKAKDDTHTIYEYATEFAAAVPSPEVRELFYGLLWDLARADGVVSEAERAILQRIPRALGIDPRWYGAYANARAESSGPYAQDELQRAYATLGVAASAGDDEIRKAYREKAKKYHPDTLRAQGLPDEMIGRATEQMKAVNAAWSAVKSARGL